jgi:hypothetical protein
MSATAAAELEIEIRTFNELRSELLKNAAGKFALVKGETLLGTFDSETAAIRHGYRTLGNVAFLVKQITEADIPLSFTSFNLGV